ncbi:hypothetical protein D3C86_1409300 [compost metagenome]
MNPSNPTDVITKNELDRLHETATRYKHIAKIITIISYVILLFGVVGAFSVSSVPFGSFFAGISFVIAFILYVFMQIPVLILTAKANHIFATTSPTYELERTKERSKNILMYKILLAFIALIVLIFLFVIVF